MPRTRPELKPFTPIHRQPQPPLSNPACRTSFESSSISLPINTNHPLWYLRKQPVLRPQRRPLPPPSMHLTEVCRRCLRVHQAVASLRAWLYLGRVHVLTLYARYDQGGYSGCQFIPPCVLDVLDGFIHPTMRPEKVWPQYEHQCLSKG